MLIILVSVLTAAMQPVLAGKEVREAARALNAYIASSVVRAAENGRPAGVWIERSSANSNAAFEIFFAEVPPLYAGDYLNDAATINSATQVTIPAGQASVEGFIEVGDSIRFNYAGPWYEITGWDPTTLTLDFSVGSKPPIPYDASDLPVPFQIQRGPRKSPISPMQLPNNTVIDLTFSGADADEFNTTDTRPVKIMFSPDGSIDRVYYFDGTVTPPSPQYTGRPLLGMLHLLVGRPDQVGTGNLGTEPNDNRWVSINHQTGRVITTENMGDQNMDGDLSDARQFAISGSGMGGG